MYVTEKQMMEIEMALLGLAAFGEPAADALQDIGYTATRGELLKRVETANEVLEKINELY